MEEETRKMEQELATKPTTEKKNFAEMGKKKKTSVYRSKGLSMTKINEGKNTSMSILTKVLCLQRQENYLRRQTKTKIKLNQSKGRKTLILNEPKSD